MIAKAKSISHGSVSLDYITRHGTAQIVKLNYLPKNVEVEAYWFHMKANQLKYEYKRSKNHPLKNDMIRIEISPSREETRGWTLADWKSLVEDFVNEFDTVDLYKLTGRESASRCNIGGSQYVATLHEDSKSGILHVHLDCNRIDMDGGLNDDHAIGIRAVTAANEVARKYGWVQAEQRAKENRQKISDDCMLVLKDMKSFSWEEFNHRMAARGYDLRFHKDSKNQVRGYTVRKGNSIYKSSELGRSRNLMPSKIQETWKGLHPDKPKVQESAPVRRVEPIFVFHPVKTEHDIRVDDETFKVTIPNESYRVLKHECGWTNILTEELEHVVKTAMLLYAGYVDAATTVSVSGGGGGSEPSSDWGRNEKEDDREWARRCAEMAKEMVTTRRRTYRR